jgi:hypothetical protein
VELPRLRHVIARALPPPEAIGPVRRAYATLHALARLLEPDGRGGTAVQADVTRWAARLGPQLRRTPAERTWRAHFRAIVRSFGARLYACYDHPQLPRTNNDLEQGLRALNRAERRITGRKHVGRRLVRTPGLIGAGACLAQATTPATAVAALPPECRRGFSARRQQRTRPRGAALAFRRDPVAFLARIEAAE